MKIRTVELTKVIGSSDFVVVRTINSLNPAPGDVFTWDEVRELIDKFYQEGNRVVLK